MDRTFSARCGRRRLLRQGEKCWLASRECLPSSATTTMLKNAHVVKIDNYVFEEDPPPARTSRLRCLRLSASVFATSLQTSTFHWSGVQITSLASRHPKRMPPSSSPSAHRVREGNDAKRDCLHPRAHSRPHLVHRRVRARRSRAAPGRTIAPSSLRLLRRRPAPKPRMPPPASSLRLPPTCSRRFTRTVPKTMSHKAGTLDPTTDAAATPGACQLRTCLRASIRGPCDTTPTRAAMARQALSDRCLWSGHEARMHLVLLQTQVLW